MIRAAGRVVGHVLVTALVAVVMVIEAVSHVINMMGDGT